MTSRLLSRALSLSVLPSLVFVSAAEAARIDLAIFENADGADVSGLDLWVDVAPAGTDQIEFTFHNDSTTASVITAVYFDASALATLALAMPDIAAQSPGVKFSSGASPGQPAGSIQHHGGAWSTLYSADADAPPPMNGINAGIGETLTVRFNLAGGYTVDDVIGAITDEPSRFRIAQHIQGLPGDASVWSVTVPSPASLGLLSGCALLAMRRRR